MNAKKCKNVRRLLRRIAKDMPYVAYKEPAPGFEQYPGQRELGPCHKLYLNQMKKLDRILYHNGN